MRQRDFIFYLFLQIALVLTFLTLSMSAQASSQSHVYNQAVESGRQEIVSGAEEDAHHGEGVNHGERHETSHSALEHMDADHQAEAPLAYLSYWAILILVMVIILIYFVYRHKNRQLRPIIPLAVFLVLFALSIYIIEIITPAFSGRFDPDTLKVVYEYHEAPNIGFLRFIYKFVLGILMTFFAFLNLDRKDFKQKSLEDQG